MDSRDRGGGIYASGFNDSRRFGIGDAGTGILAFRFYDGAFEHLGGFLVQAQKVDDRLGFTACADAGQAAGESCDDRVNCLSNLRSRSLLGLFLYSIFLALEKTHDNRDVGLGLRSSGIVDGDRGDLLVAFDDPICKGRVCLRHCFDHGLSDFIDVLDDCFGGVHDDLRHGFLVKIQTVHIHVADKGFCEKVLVDRDHVFEIQFVFVVFLVK